MATKDNETSGKTNTETEVEETEETSTETEASEEETSEESGGEAESDKDKPDTKNEKTGLSALLDGDEEETADYELEVPEGVDAKLVEEVAAFAKESGLSEEQAKGVLEREIARRSSMEEEAQREIEAYGQQLLAELKVHPKLGGENLNATAQKAMRVLEEIGDPALKEAFENPVYGYNATFLNALVTVHDRFIAEDTFVEGSPVKQNEPVPKAKKMFPNAKT